MIGIRLGISIQETRACVGRPLKLPRDLTAFPKIVAENHLKPRERKETKTERKVLPKPIPDPTPVCSCAENRTGPKKPYDSCAHTHP